MQLRFKLTYGATTQLFSTWDNCAAMLHYLVTHGGYSEVLVSSELVPA